jgi:SAM-dependent methyltransferase
MNPTVVGRLIELNHAFYEQFGESFSATRSRLQPGVAGILKTLRGDESILDLGCGNGTLARELNRRGHQGRYLGLDFSLPLLHAAQSGLDGFPATFLRIDLTQFPLVGTKLPVSGPWSVVTCFAALHHIPGERLRLEILRTVHRLLETQGRFILSNWQFLNSGRLPARIQSWDLAGLADSDVDPGDYLLDWKQGGLGLRYVHHFSSDELGDLAARSGFDVMDSFLSDGEGDRLGLYQEWKKKPG